MIPLLSKREVGGLGVIIPWQIKLFSVENNLIFALPLLFILASSCDN